MCRPPSLLGTGRGNSWCRHPAASWQSKDAGEFHRYHVRDFHGEPTVQFARPRPKVSPRRVIPAAATTRPRPVASTGGSDARAAAAMTDTREPRGSIFGAPFPYPSPGRFTRSDDPRRECVSHSGPNPARGKRVVAANSSAGLRARRSKGCASLRPFRSSPRKSSGLREVRVGPQAAMNETERQRSAGRETSLRAMLPKNVAYFLARSYEVSRVVRARTPTFTPSSAVRTVERCWLTVIPPGIFLTF